MQKASAIYYGLSIFVLMTAFFVMQPTKIPEVAAMQTETKQQFSVAWQQTMGDGPYFETFADIYDGIAAFYDQASYQTVVLLTQPDTDEALYYVFTATYKEFTRLFRQNHVQLAETIYLAAPDKFMSEPAIDNIVPETSFADTGTLTGSIAGAAIMYEESQPVNKENSWVTIQDNFTGQKYCLAVYNGEVNKYLGPCKDVYR